MSDDLVNRLRWLGDHASFEPNMHHTAADHIEQLWNALKSSMEDNHRRTKELEDALLKIAKINNGRDRFSMEIDSTILQAMRDSE
jgi:hypothetical protein